MKRTSLLWRSRHLGDAKIESLQSGQIDPDNAVKARGSRRKIMFYRADIIPAREQRSEV